jgi:hypothetical protein
MDAKTGIKLSKSSMSQLMNRLNITRKKKTTLYEDSFLPINQERKEDFIKLHDPFSRDPSNIGYHSLLLSCSTDESGFDNQSRRETGRSEIKKSPKKSKKNAGKSYRNNGSRVYGKAKKHSQFTLHLIATICLDPTNPVPEWHISKITLMDQNLLSIYWIESFLIKSNLILLIDMELIKLEKQILIVEIQR